jgi:hypothetical protein
VSQLGTPDDPDEADVPRIADAGAMIALGSSFDVKLPICVYEGTFLSASSLEEWKNGQQPHQASSL